MSSQKCQSGDDPKNKQKESFRHFVYYQGTPKKEISDARFSLLISLLMFDMEIIARQILMILFRLSYLVHKFIE